jgi:amino acid adenylation domain-containing protein
MQRAVKEAAMRDLSNALASTPLWQQAIRARCAHPTGTFVPFTRADTEQSIPSRFEQQVRQNPTRLAVKSGHRAWRYDELDHLVNGVAHAVLAQRGERPEPVALLFDHGVLFIAAILGVLKAGKFYVPLDPSYPLARLRYMVQDAQTGLLLTSNKDLTLASELVQPGCQLLNLEALPSSIGNVNPGLAIAPEALAYIIYTSGSTSQPKGVMQSHRNVLHKIMISTNDYHLSSADRRTLLYSPSSSGSVWEIFSSMLNGGSLHVFDMRADGIANMASWLMQEDITIYSSVPTLFRQVFSTLTGAERFPRLRMVNLGGEAISKKDVELYKAHFSPDCIMVTTLAATETGTFRRYFVDQDTEFSGAFVPAGYPVDDKDVLLLDDQGQEVGGNQSGEIVVKGRYMAVGYWRRPELTQSKFLPAPEEGDTCIYHTGDLGRMLPDGCLIYMGREDSQVKVRGHRVEIAEIEMALLGLGTLKEAVVIQRADDTGEQRLVAYVVPVSQPAPTVSALRRTLATVVPAHMLPAAFVRLEALPLTPAGKVDRRALPEPDRARPDLENPFVPPRLPIETQVAAIWADVMGLEQVGLYDNFLELGGHSLQATQIIARVIHTLRVELPVQALFNAPTVAEMALLIIQHQAKQATPEDMERMLTELEALSDESAKKLRADDGASA